MSEKSTKVRLQISVDEETRRTLKALAAKTGLDMSDLGGTVLDYILGLMENGKTPPALDQLIKQVVKRKKEEKEKEEE